VVMGVTSTVIHNGLLLDALLGDRDRKIDDAFRGFQRRGSKDTDLQCIQAFPRISVTHLGQMLPGSGIHPDFVTAQAAFGISESSINQFFQILNSEWIKLKDL